MKKFLCFILICYMFAAIGGCASVTTGMYQNLPIDSSPQGADVTINSGYKGITPCSFNLKRNIEHVITIAKKGYRTAQIQLKRDICGSTAGNMLVGGLIGLGVDAMTGACFKLIPEKVYVELIPSKEEAITVIEAAKTQREIAQEKKKQEEKIAEERRKPILTKDNTPVTAKDGLPVTTGNKIKSKNTEQLLERDTIPDAREEPKKIPKEKAISKEGNDSKDSDISQQKVPVTDNTVEGQKKSEETVNFTSNISTEEVVERAKEELQRSGNSITDTKIDVNRDGNIWKVTFSSILSNSRRMGRIVILKETTEGSLDLLGIQNE